MFNIAKTNQRRNIIVEFLLMQVDYAVIRINTLIWGDFRSDANINNRHLLMSVHLYTKVLLVHTHYEAF